jgi:hypothetical protein
MKLRITIDVDDTGHEHYFETAEPRSVAYEMLDDHGPAYQHEILDAEWVTEGERA